MREVQIRISILFHKLIQEVQMGATVTLEDVGGDQKKFQTLLKARDSLINDFASKKAAQGKIIFESNLFLKISDSANERSIRNKLVELFGSVAHLGFSFTFDVAPGHFFKALEDTRKFNIPFQATRSYPLVINEGFAMLHAGITIEKFFPDKAKNPNVFKMIFTGAFKVLKPQVSISRSDYANFISFSSLQGDLQRKRALDAVWQDIQSQWTNEYIDAEIKRLEQLIKYRKQSVQEDFID